MLAARDCTSESDKALSDKEFPFVLRRNPSRRMVVSIASAPMPPDERFRLNNGNGVQHRWDQAIEPNEEQSVGYCQPRFRGNAMVQQVQLMPQQDDLGSQPRLRPEQRNYDVEE